MSAHLNSRSLTGEFLGTAILLATVIGSGIMGESLSGGNIGIALLANSIATGAILVVLITVFIPISGAHFNPAVTLIELILRKISLKKALLYLIVQIAGAVFGVFIAHLMFDQSIIQISTHARSGTGQFVSEFIATFGLIATILGTLRSRPDLISITVALYITAAYWFTASTSFANPAVTIARMFSNTFAGIAPINAPLFILAQILGAITAVYIFGWLLGKETPRSHPTIE